MKYKNPIIPGFYPDPSICKAGTTYYLVCSSFQYYPSVPLFESNDLINWNQIGHVLTRESQLSLENAGASDGIFAPTIRYNEGRFYMVTTDITGIGNFYVWTDDIHGEWSDPIKVDQGGIDPSLYFEDNKAYFMSNGLDDEGNEGITQCEIDIVTGKKLTPSRCIWKGTGGRFLESPHLYKIDKVYYLMAAEGGTEYGHMVVYARGNTPYGPFENYPGNPVLTNRNLGGYRIQGCGHSDLVQDDWGNWWMVHLAFRQMSKWELYHTTGREVYLVPVTFNQEGWFTAGVDGTTRSIIETDRLPEGTVQTICPEYNFNNTKIGREWCFIRYPHKDCYSFDEATLKLTGTEVTLESEKGSPTAVFLRQKEMIGDISCEVTVQEQEAGITLYMDQNQHYDLAVRKTTSGYEIIKRICIGDVKCIQKSVSIATEAVKITVSLRIHIEETEYSFEAACGEDVYPLDHAMTKYLSTEVAGGFTGVMIGLYAQGDGVTCRMPAEFSDFRYVIPATEAVDEGDIR